MRCGSPYDGLERRRWRSILVRAAVFRAARRTLAEFCDHIDQGGIALFVLMDLEVLAQALAAGETDDLDDDQLVSRIVLDWDKRLAAMLDGALLGADLRRLLVEIRSLLSHACATDPFQEIFARVTAKAEAIYRDKWRPASLEMAHLGKPPRGGQDPYAITAATEWSRCKTSANVELAIHDEGFRPAAFAALPMLFTHECICHVPARQDRVANDSTFAEGLLDWVAFDLHQQWAGMLDSVLAPAARQHAQMLRHFLALDKSDEGSARRRGHRAAERLRTWFEDRELALHGGVDVDFTEVGAIHVIRLALALNVIDRPLADKDAFVALLGSSFPPDLEAALEEWLAGTITAEALLDVEGAGL